MYSKGKTIIVTGGGNGVGRELVLQLLNKGAKVLAVDINPEALKETERAAGKSDNLYLYTVDISKAESVVAFAEKALRDHQKIDGLINNAGIIQPFVSVEKLDMERIERVMNINFYGTLYMVKAFLPHFKTRPIAHIVNVSSMGGFLPVPGQSIYGASKAAVKLFSEGLSSELSGTNVNVSIIVPGGIASNIMKNSNVATSVSKENANTKLLLSTEKAAELIIKAMEKNRLTTYIGKDSNFMKILHKINPGFSMKMINKVMSGMAH